MLDFNIYLLNVKKMKQQSALQVNIKIFFTLLFYSLLIVLETFWFLTLIYPELKNECIGVYNAVSPYYVERDYILPIGFSNIFIWAIVQLAILFVATIVVFSLSNQQCVNHFRKRFLKLFSMLLLLSIVLVLLRDVATIEMFSYTIIFTIFIFSTIVFRVLFTVKSMSVFYDMSACELRTLKVATLSSRLAFLEICDEKSIYTSYDLLKKINDEKACKDYQLTPEIYLLFFMGYIKIENNKFLNNGI